MELTLKNINLRGDNNSIIYFTLNVKYGYNDEMYDDTIKLIYNRAKKKAAITVDAINPGVGHVVERIIESINKIDFNKKNLTRNATIIEIITDMLVNLNSMKYDQEMLDNAVKILAG